MTMLKAFTRYRCSKGCGASRWTGAYTLPKETDSECYCGGTMTEEVSDGFRYRVEFESIDPHQAAELEARLGKGVWPLLSDEQWEALSWHPVSREAEFIGEIEDQATNLAAWAASHEQPIRNVRLLRSANPGWGPVATNTTPRGTDTGGSDG